MAMNTELSSAITASDCHSTIAVKARSGEARRDEMKHPGFLKYLDGWSSIGTSGGETAGYRVVKPVGAREFNEDTQNNSTPL